jgi:hypothetical protein
MGALCCKIDSGEPAPPLNNDAHEKQSENSVALKSLQEQFRGTVYFDALDTLDAENQKDEIFEQSNNNSFRYAPATIANPYPRASIAFDKIQTLLAPSKKDLKSTILILNELKEPEQKVNLEGYPGNLTKEELDACQLFRKTLKERDPSYRDMVNSLDAEEEVYAICRFMRSRNFDVNAVFQMMDECIDLWKAAAKHDFFPSLEQSLGCSPATFFTQFPAVYSGLARNGTPVFYIQMGSMTLEGLECLATAETLSRYVWYHSKTEHSHEVAALQEANQDIVARCEETYIVDLKNLRLEQINKAFIETIKKMFVPSACFPEFLNKAVILNAPGFFSFTWRIVKVFLHPRTVRKVEIYSDSKKANKRLEELLYKSHIPSDYGGDAPTFQKIAEKRYCGEGRRQLHKLLSKQNGTTIFDFSLEHDEIATVIVFARGAGDFSIAASRSDVKNLSKVDGTGNPNSKEIAKELKGPECFCICLEASQQANNYFLVLADIERTQ